MSYGFGDGISVIFENRKKPPRAKYESQEAMQAHFDDRLARGRADCRAGAGKCCAEVIVTNFVPDEIHPRATVLGVCLSLRCPDQNYPAVLAVGGANEQSDYIVSAARVHVATS